MENIFGIRLKEIRKIKGITQVELAEMINTSQSAITDYELGKKFPTVPVIIRIAKALNVSADYLLGLTDNPQPWNNDLPESIIKRLQDCDKLKEDYDDLKHMVEQLYRRLTEKR